MIRDIGYLTILKTGPGTSIQDLGRIGYADFGVPASGGLDMRSLSWVNHLLKNKVSDAVLEICQPGLHVKFDSPTLICLAGAQSTIKLNGALICSNGTMEVQSNDEIEIGSFSEGSTLYLGVKNGFQTGEIINSRSWFKGITDADFAKKADQIPYFTNQQLPVFTASKAKWNFEWSAEQSIEVYPGPDWKLLNHKNQKIIESTEFTISDLKNRMAIQLTELLPNSMPEMITAPVFPGTVQLTSGGKLLILMKDAQVTGGYPRILHVTEKGLSILAQKKPQQKIRFRLI